MLLTISSIVVTFSYCIPYCVSLYNIVMSFLSLLDYFVAFILTKCSSYRILLSHIKEEIILILYIH